MMPVLVPFTQTYLQPAVELFLHGYRREQSSSPCLPSRAIDEPSWIYAALKTKLANPGIAVIEQDRLLAYMITSNWFSWKGQKAVIVHEYCHSAVEAGKQELYQKMYMRLAQEWANRQVHLHLIGHFAHDALLQETLYQLGFGGIIAERLSDGSTLDRRQNALIREERNIRKLLDLHIEHIQYYPQAPIFLARFTDRKAALTDLEAHAQAGDVFFVYEEQDKPCAYLIVGKCTIGGEGFLLQETNTAQIKSAYAQPGVRGKGIGFALTQRALQWSQDQGYDRVFVEHETANIAGGNFWRKYFTPYLYFSMRYIDCTL